MRYTVVVGVVSLSLYIVVAVLRHNLTSF
jgi:hypothetical protein